MEIDSPLQLSMIF